jgi:hypothetical protein
MRLSFFKTYWCLIVIAGVLAVGMAFGSISTVMADNERASPPNTPTYNSQLREVTFNQLTKVKKALCQEGSAAFNQFNIKGYVIQQHTFEDCPPCPEDAVCETCQTPFILLGERDFNPRRSMYFYFPNNAAAQQFTEGDYYAISFIIQKPCRQFPDYRLIGFKKLIPAS